MPWEEVKSISCRLTDLFTGAVYEGKGEISVWFRLVRVWRLGVKLCAGWNQDFQWKIPIPNSKHEMRISKQIRIFQIQMFFLEPIAKLLKKEAVIPGNPGEGRGRPGI